MGKRKYLIPAMMLCFITLNCSSKREPLSNELTPHWSSENVITDLTNWGLLDAAFTSGNAGWAVGIENFSSSNNRRGVLLKYNGSQWNEETINGISTDWLLTSIKAISNSDIWVAGADYERDKNNPEALILHYDGLNWEKIIPRPDTDNIEGYIKSIDFSPSGEGWAAGTYHANGLLLKYENSSWRKFLFERPPFSYWGLTTISYDLGNTWWLSGWEIASDLLGFMYKFVNGEWVQENPLKIDYEYSINSFFFNSPSDGWAAGRYQIAGNLSRGLIMRYENNQWYKWGLAGHPFQDVEFFSVFPTPGNRLYAAGGVELPYIAYYTDIFSSKDGDYVNLSIKDGIIRALHFVSENEGWAIGTDLSKGIENATGLILKYENFTK